MKKLALLAVLAAMISSCSCTIDLKPGFGCDTNRKNSGQ